MANKRPKPQPLILKVTLENVEPAVWRRFAVPRDIVLGELHEVIQTVMGWQNCHLHEFHIDDARYGMLDPDAPRELQDEEDVTLAGVAGKAGSGIRYWYDFGDDWWHLVEIEGDGDAKTFKQMPVCIAGEQACPPEDCGGPWGYADMLEALRDPSHEQHDDYREWLGGAFDPAEFDLAEVNENLRLLR